MQAPSRLRFEKRTARSIVLAVVALAALAWPLLQVDATGDVTVTGRFQHDHGDLFTDDRSVEYAILETPSQRLVLNGVDPGSIAPQTRIRVRGRLRGNELRVAAAAGSVQTVPTIARTPTTAAFVASDSATVPQIRRVAVVLVNFVTPSATPSAPATSRPPATSGSPLPSELPPPTTSPMPTDSPAPTDSPMPTDTPIVETDPAVEPDDSPLPTDSALPTDSPAATDTPQPTDTPSATDTPLPTDSPLPSDSPLPTDTPLPGDTPLPTLAPTPTPLPTPTSTPPPQPWTQAQVAGVYFNNERSVAGYYADLSDGSISISGDVFGWYTVPAQTNTCDYSGWATAARQAATAAGVALASYTNVVYAFPKQSACWWLGLANVSGRSSWINGSLSLYVTAHELGHNFGVHHASSISCSSGGSRVAFSSNCSTDEYGDPFDVMGDNDTHLMSAWHRWQIGLMSPDEVQTVTASGSFQVGPAHLTSALPRIIRIPRSNGDFYYLEFRQATARWDDFAASAPVVNGVTIRIAPDVSKVVPSKLIDTNPQTATYVDSALTVGRTFSDSINQIFVTTTAVSADGATVSIHLGRDSGPPSSVGSITTVLNADGSVRLDWPPATDDVWVAGYRVKRDGKLIKTVNSPTFTDVAPAQAQTHTYEVAAVDPANNVGATTTASVFVPDVVAPTAVVGLAAQQTGSQSVALTWAAASDNLGVSGYQVSRDGALLGQSSATSFQDVSAPEGVTCTYAVTAVDAAGNIGAAASTTVALVDMTAPGLTGTLDASISSDFVSLSWAAAADNVGVDHFELKRNGEPLTTTTTTQLVDGPLAEGSTYVYSVVAIDTAGLESSALTASVYVPDSTPPTAPDSLIVALTSPGVLSVTWSAATDNVGVDHYVLTVDGTTSLPSTSTAIGDIVVADGSTHALNLTAVDGAGNESSVTSATIDVPDATRPSTPVLTATTVGTVAVALSWTAATDNVGVTGYVVARDAVPLETTSSATLTLSDTTAVPDVAHVYTVSALDAAGNIGTPSSATVTLVSQDVTAPSVPTTLRAVALSKRRVSITWSASSDNRSGAILYQVFRGTTKIATVSSLSFIDRPARIAKYRYKVRAVDAAGNKSPFTTYLTVKTRR